MMCSKSVESENFLSLSQSTHVLAAEHAGIVRRVKKVTSQKFRGKSRRRGGVCVRAINELNPIKLLVQGPIGHTDGFVSSAGALAGAHDENHIFRSTTLGNEFAAFRTR